MPRGRKNTDSAATDTPPEELRGANRRAIILHACQQITALEEERKAVGNRIKEVKGRIKAELGYKIADFNAALRLYQLEDEARDTFIDTLKETFEALGIGGQLDWIETVEREPKLPDSYVGAFDLGKKAGVAGANLADCPYPTKDKKLRASWEDGFEKGQFQAAQAKGNGAAEARPEA
jgi:ribosome modulation factor